MRQQGRKIQQNIPDSLHPTNQARPIYPVQRRLDGGHRRVTRLPRVQNRLSTKTGGLFEQASAAPAAQELARRVGLGGVLSCAGVCGSAQPFVVALLRRLFPQRPIVVVTEGLKTQETFLQDIETWLGRASQAEEGGQGRKGEREKLPPALPLLRSPALFYPAWESLPHEPKLPHADVISERLETLVALMRNAECGMRNAEPRVGHSAIRPAGAGHSTFIIASVTALLQRTFTPAALAARTRTLRRGDRVNPLDLIEWLEDQAYEPEAQVTAKGELALRGGIVDAWPLTSPWPVRLEFFGDELESLRHFDPLTQLSRDDGVITEVTLPPAGELGILKRAVGQVPGSEFRVSSAAGAAGHDNSEPRTRNSELKFATLLDYLPRETVLVLCEPESLAEQAGAYAAQVPDGDPFFIGWEAFLSLANSRGMTTLALSEEVPFSDSDSSSSSSSIRSREFEDEDDAEPSILKPSPSVLDYSTLDAFRPLAERAPEPQVAAALRREFFAQLHRWLQQDFAVHIFCNNDGERQRFGEVWRELNGDAESPKSKVQSPKSGDAVASGGPWALDLGLWAHLGSLARGFLCEEAKLVVVTDAEIFGRYKIQRARRLKSPHAAATRSALDIDFTELSPGDLVVHLQHGIGRFTGLQILPAVASRSSSSIPQSAIRNPQSEGTECLVIEYAPADPEQQPPKLYVPVTEAHLVSKYVGAGKARPPLHKLGGTRWTKTKEHAERAVRDLAAELLAIQAARATQPGHAFKADTTWQHEFEGAFIFEETPDQARAITETKTDMERPKPMDRLICGDVGYGKTEVAIRAAFKAVMDGRQVAVLVPTTVLAQQHFNTFRERMADYPVRIELLSRFRTRREQARVVRDLAAGAVDIVIGTHRLIQSDIAFKDLSLVVIDEEQRFGVMHKEKFKLLRRMVDVLTLSATPIPRTLYLALTGARDMSTIQTPPQDRLPVETIVCEYDERVIRDAIQREINRGGQVFFLHNRVTTIDAMKFRLMQLVPDARIVVGHGQMNSDDLEEVMTAFVNGEADVLLSTTIIESGLDIPNANTIFVDRADRFGLSDLYQLRGRVGRYKHQAFAYLLIPRHARMLTDARKRISAIRQYSSLGSGFKIAMRDLEIRGAGNLLGSEQSGHITAVGFELYCQLLKHSIAALKGEKLKPRVPVEVRLDFLDTRGAEEAEECSVFSVQCSDAELPSQAPRVGRRETRNSKLQTPNSRLATLPRAYIAEPHHRIEIYCKLAQAEDKAALDALSREVRDRFGPLPAAVELLFLVTELKILASERGVTAIETDDDKLKLTRHGDFMQFGGKFPRLTKKEPKAKLGEIKRLLLALQPQA